MATNTERITALENLLQAAGFHQPTCTVIVTPGPDAVCDCWIASQA